MIAKRPMLLVTSFIVSTLLAFSLTAFSIYLTISQGNHLFFLFCLFFIIVLWIVIWPVTFLHLSIVYLNSLLYLAKKKKRKYHIFLGAFKYLIFVRKTKLNKAEIKKELLLNLVDALEKAVQLFPEDDVIFMVGTWLLDKHQLEKLSNNGIKISPSSSCKLNRYLLGATAAVANGDCKYLKRFIDMNFYDIEFKKQHIQPYIADIILKEGKPPT